MTILHQTAMTSTCLHSSAGRVRVFLCLLLVLCVNSVAVWAEETEDTLPPAAFAERHETVFSATTEHPISLHRGLVLEQATDFSLTTPVSDFSHTRTYTGRLRGANGSAPSTSGVNWFGGISSRVLSTFEGGVRIRWDASSSKMFDVKEGKYAARDAFNASLLKRGDAAAEEYVLLLNDTHIAYVFYGADNRIDEKLRGKIKERTTRQFLAQARKGDRFFYDASGLLDHVVTAAPQNNRIQYSYIGQDDRTRLKKIQVFDDADARGAKTVEVEYLYFEELENAHEDVGTEGDLVQIKTSVLAGDKKTWKTSTVHYRYHRTDKKNDALEGGDHQVKMVLESDAVARVLDGDESLKTSEAILEKGDAEALSGGLTLTDYASRTFGYYVEATSANTPLRTVWGEENLVTRYGNPERNLPIPRGHVKTEMVRAGCATCGGGSASGGMRKTYYYLYVNTPSRRPTTADPDAAVYVIVEDTCDSGGKPAYRTIYSLNARGAELRKIDIENPTAEILNTVATSSKRNAGGRIIETRSSDVHALIRDDKAVAQFLNPYDAETKSRENDLATMEKKSGRIEITEYDDNRPPKAIAAKVKFGAEGEAYFVSATDYDADGQVIAEYAYPTKTTDRNDAARSATLYRYAYWDDDRKIIKTKETIEPAIPLAQNGPGIPSITREYYDRDGRLRWQKSPSGVVDYYAYHPISGARALTVRDVDTAKSPVVVTGKNSGIPAWNGPAPFARNPKLEKPLHQIDRVEFDERGKRLGRVDEDGIRDVTLESADKTIRFSRWKAAEKRLLSPVSVEELNKAGDTVASYTLPVSAVIVENDMPVGVDLSARKLTLTRYAYDPVQGNPLHVDRYHTIPENGEGELGKHFYRSVSIYDPMGRVVATADYLREGAWSVNAQKYDWRGRTVETLRASAMNPPHYVDLADESWIETVSKTFYDGERNAKAIMMTGKGPNEYRGTKYRYDNEGRLRGTVAFYNDDGTEKSHGPYTVSDYDWRGNVTASADYSEEPDWKAVAENDVFARKNASSRLTLTLSHHNSRGMTYRTEQFTGNAGQNDLVTRRDVYTDVEGRTVAVESTGGAATEIAYNSFGSNYQMRTVTALSTEKFKDGGFVYVNPKPHATLADHQGGADGVLRMTHNEFDDRGRTVAVHQLDGTDPSGIDFGKNDYVRQTTFMWYDNQGNLAAQADYGSGDPENGTGGWNFFPCPQRPQEPPERSSEAVVVTKNHIEPNPGDTDTSIDFRGIVTKSFKDALGRNVRQVMNFVEDGKADDENVTTLYEYDARGQVVSVTDPLGNTTKREYDDQSHMVCEIDAEGNRTKYEYDFEGKTVAVIDPLGRTTNFEYDNLGRRVKTTLPAPTDGAERPVETIVYDELGRVSRQIDPLGNTKRFTYDDLGRIVTEIDAAGGETKFTYDSAGRRTSLTDPVGNTTVFVYDILGRLTKETNALEKSRSFEYIGNRPVRKTDRNGRVTEYVYDRFGRMKEERWLDGGKVVDTLKFESNWDGTLKNAGDGNFRFDYEYDKFGREIASTVKIDSEIVPIVQKTTYDALDRRIAFESGGKSTHYSYTPTGRIAAIKQNDKSVEYSYNAAGQRIAAITPAAATTYAYDGLGRLTKIKHGDIAKYDYSWDAANRITSMNDAKYGYDKTSQLISADYEKLPAEKYDYDPNGNRLNFKTGPNNRLLSDGKNTYTYDDEGNCTSKGATKYHWDHRNRLVKVVNGDLTVEYKYDHLNRLYKRNDEFFVHDGWQVVKVLDSQGRTKETYFWGANQDELIACNENYAICDHLGTVRDLVDATGKAVAHLEYSVFGELLSCTGILTRFRYTGKLFDTETNLQWNINRWYDPKAGRWCSEDPIEFEAKDTNLNRYVGNEVVQALDIHGLAWGYIGLPGNRSKKPRAPVSNSDKNDTVKQLGAALDLNAREYKKWLKSEDGKPLPASAETAIGTGCRVFSVPNKIVYYKQKRQLMDISIAVNSLQAQAGLYTSQLQLEGYFPVRITSGNKADFQSNFKDEDVLMFIFAGHGHN